MMKINRGLYEFTFKEINNLSGSENMLPESLKAELNRHFIKDGLFYTFFELRFPNKKSSIKFDKIYDCNSDDGSWVERIIFSLEEERIGAELQKMEDIVNNNLYAPDVEEEAEEVEEKIEELKAQELRTADENLGIMEFGEEIFVPKKNGDSWILINAFKDKVTRGFYDNLFRCYKEELWEINQEKEDLKKTVKTEYYKDSYKTSSKSFITSDSEKKQMFNSNGFLSKEENYKISEDEKIIQSKLSIKYNKDNKVIESNIIEYTYDDKENDKLLYTFNKKYLYKYNDDDIPPNFDYYEEGNLKIRNIYLTEDTYTSEIFFDEGFRVKTFYKDGKLVKEDFITNNNNERTKYYE